MRILLCALDRVKAFPIWSLAGWQFATFTMGVPDMIASQLSWVFPFTALLFSIAGIAAYFIRKHNPGMKYDWEEQL